MKNLLVGTIRIVTISLLLAGMTSLKIMAQPLQKNVLQQQAFERIFGDAARLDTAMVRKVKTDKPGKRHYVDHNGDGKPEEVWFIDTDPRHTASKRPMLVRAIDEDNDMVMGGEPDLDSDLYIADWNADGIVDAAIDYEDLDRDQDVDQMGLYSYGGEDVGIWVWWGRDDGDDNLLWYNVDYRYYQSPCQFNSHFGGDETFNYMFLKPGSDTWVPIYENPFLFYDRDSDGVTEEVIRIEGKGDLVQYLRWSFDADNDATTGQPRDYDVAVTACAPGWTVEKDKESDFSLHLGKELSEILTVRGFPTAPILKRSAAVDFIENVTWARVQLTWDENDLNRARNKSNNYMIDRWEGIIASGYKEPGFYMPQIGGPDCGPFNKRYELVLNPTGLNEYYFNPADHRIHIKNSNKSWINVDFDGDLKTDMNYNWIDSNGDGIMDQMTVDIDGDDKVDDSWNTDVSGVKLVKWKFEDVNAAFAPVVLNEPPRLYLLDKMLTKVLESIRKNAGQEPIWDLLQQNMRGAKFSEEVAHSLINSDETIMYYLRLIRDRQIAKLRKLGAGSKSFWKTFETARGKDNSEKMISALNKMFRTGIPVQDYEKWLAQRRDKDTSPRVAWDSQWVAPNWGWESEKTAYRIYDGHFDLFGKSQEKLIYPLFTKGKSYHTIQDWGMDVLNVGITSGCGGVTLYINGVAYPVRNEKNPGDPTFSGRLIEETPDKVTLELLAKGVGPAKAPYTVRLRPSALAGRSDSPIEVLVEGGSPGDKIELGIGLTRLKEDTFLTDLKVGVMGLWGFQQPEIGWIGMGIIYPVDRYIRMDHQPEEYRVILRCETGKPIVYHIQGDWLRGHRFSCCPSAQDWLSTLIKTAAITGMK